MNNLFIFIVLITFTIHFVNCDYRFNKLCKTVIDEYNELEINGFYEFEHHYSSNDVILTRALRAMLEKGFLLDTIIDKEALKNDLNKIVKDKNQELVIKEAEEHYFKKILELKNFEVGKGVVNIDFKYYVPALDSEYNPKKNSDKCVDPEKLPPLFSKGIFI